ncbi:MAG: hypothetical protein FWG87_06965 [Defluviitaleaceae bacterium]|nr:hypothetical protein [Defluviitaleaceae bacterium]
MSDKIKFDFARAQSLLDLLSECSAGLGELSASLGDEINGAGQWWKGESYDAFKAKYSDAGKGKSTIEALGEKTKELNSYLGKLADAKKNLEQSTARAF